MKVGLKLQRKIGFFVMRLYIPSILTVMLSWVGFWINRNAEPARVALGITTVLTMTTLAASTRQIKVSYLKAIDVWYGTCLFLVFAALVEFTLVNVVARGERRQAEQVGYYSFYQRGSIASYASADIARAEMSVCPSVCLSARPSVCPSHSVIVSKRRKITS